MQELRMHARRQQHPTQGFQAAQDAHTYVEAAESSSDKVQSARSMHSLQHSLVMWLAVSVYGHS